MKERLNFLSRDGKGHCSSGSNRGGKLSHLGRRRSKVLPCLGPVTVAFTNKLCTSCVAGTQSSDGWGDEVVGSWSRNGMETPLG